MPKDKQLKMPLFAIQSCPILHGPVIVFDSRDVEILKQLGVSSIAHDDHASIPLNYSLVRDIEEAKDIKKGEFYTTPQLPDILPKSIHTIAAAQILRLRRRVPFEHKTFSNYTQVMKYLKSSPASLEILEGRQFDLKKPLVGPASRPPRETTDIIREPPRTTNVIREPPTSTENAEKLTEDTGKSKEQNEKSQEGSDKAKEDTDQTDKVVESPTANDDKPSDQEDSAKRPMSENHVEKTQEKSNDTEVTIIEQSTEKSTEKPQEQNMNTSEVRKVIETPEVNIESEQEKLGTSDVNKETDQENTEIPKVSMETEEGKSETPEVSMETEVETLEVSMDTEEEKSETPEVNMETVVENRDTSQVSKMGEGHVDAVHANNTNNNTYGVKGNQVEEAKIDDSNAVTQQQSVEAPREASTSPASLQDAVATTLSGAELVKLRKRSSVKATFPLPPPPDATAPKKRARPPTKKRGPKNPKLVNTALAPVGAALAMDAAAPLVAPNPATALATTATTTVPKRRGRLPMQAKTVETTENSTRSTTPAASELPSVEAPAVQRTTSAASELPSVEAPAVQRSPIKKRGRPPKAKPVVVQAVIAPKFSPVNDGEAHKPPVKKRGRAAKEKQAAESVTAEAAAAAIAPVPDIAAAVAPQESSTKKRGHSPGTKTATTANRRASSPPKKRGRPPKNQATVEAAVATVGTTVEPVSAVPPPPTATIQPRNPSTGSASSDVTPVAATTNATTAANTNATAVATATNAMATDPVMLSPPRKSRQDSIGDEPFTPNYASDGSSTIGESLTPVPESPVTTPAGPAHFSTRTAGAKWNEKFLELFRYKMQYGNCNVSAKGTDNPHKALGEWVKIQRRRKNGKSKSLKPLSMEEEAKLNAIGFDWRSAGMLEWEDRYRQLVKYKMAYGNVDVPSDYAENPSLAAWCAAQRKYWRQKLQVEKQQSMDVGDESQDSAVAENGKKKNGLSPMTDEQEGKLLALGFQF